MVADIVGLRRVGTVEDIGVAAWGAWSVGELGCRLVVAQIHPEPEGDPVLEVEGSTGSVLGRQDRRVLRHDHPVLLVVPRARGIGIEQQRRLVVASVCAFVPERVDRLGTDRAALVTEKLLGTLSARRGRRRWVADRRQQHDPAEYRECLPHSTLLQTGVRGTSAPMHRALARRRFRQGCPVERHLLPTRSASERRS